MNIKSRHHLKGSDARKIIADIEPFLDDSSRLRKSSLEMAISDEDVDLIFIDGRPLLMIVDKQPFFTVLGAIELAPIKRLVVVDAGAVRFVVNGADIMKPGIVSADPEIAVGDLVVIIEERHKKPLAIGRALVAGTEMKGEGKAVKSLHHVGDAIWKCLEE
jgi:PUA domain protein